MNTVPRTSGAAPSQSRGGRRQVTVAFIDLVGSTALAQRLDPEDFEEMLGRYHALCEAEVVRFGGHVEQFQGDGVLCCFGYPAAHEDDAARAVRAALEIAAEVGRLSFPGRKTPLEVRAGIATGLTVVDMGSTGSAGNRVAIGGDTPSIASRIQAMAEPGSVAIAGSTKRIVEGGFDLVPMGTFSLKGLLEPQDLWRVAGTRNVGSRFEARSPRPSPIVGRDTEMETLLAAWRRGVRGRGEVVLVSGEAGIGKSRIIRELGLHPAKPHRFTLYQCSPQRENSAFWPFVKRLDDRLGDRDRSPERLAALMAEAGVGDGDAVALLAPLLSVDVSIGDDVRSYSPEKRRDRTAELLVRIATAGEGALALIVIEDMHWADPSTVELAGRIASRIVSTGGLLVMSFRPDFDPAVMALPAATMIALDNLDAIATTSLIGSLTRGRDLPFELLEAMRARADGVPLFIEELTRSVLESGIVREVGDTYELNGDANLIAIPTTLKDSLMARLDRLGPVREVAQIASAIGREFHRDLLAMVIPEEGSLDPALARLVASGLVSPAGASDAGAFVFRHALIQDAAYESMLRSTRQRLHGQLASAIAVRSPATAETEPEVLARHLTRAGRSADAAPLWLRAGQRALARSALAEAIAHFSAALSAIEGIAPGAATEELELAIRLGLGGAYIAQRGWASEEVRSTTDPARALAGRSRNDRLLVTAMFQVWVNRMTRSEYGAALEVAEELIEQGRTRLDPSLRTHGEGMAAQTLYFVGRFREALQRMAACAALAEAGRDSEIVTNTNHEIVASSEARVGTAHWILGHPDRARTSAERTIRSARDTRHAFNLAFVLAISSHTYFYLDDIGAAAANIDEALGIAANQRLASLQRMTLPLYEGRKLLYLGRFADGLRVALPALDAMWASRQRNTVSHNRVMIGRLLIGLGDVEAGLAQIETGIAIADETGDVFELAELWRIRGTTLERLDRPAEAEASYRRAIAIARQQEARSWELRAATNLADLLGRNGAKAAALAVLHPPLQWFSSGPPTSDTARARSLAGRLDGGG